MLQAFEQTLTSILPDAVLCRAAALADQLCMSGVWVYSPDQEVNSG
jgi:hypothetical protein